MKKLLLVLFVGATFSSISQSNSNLRTIINPLNSRGYMHWVGDNSPKYSINIYEVDDTTSTLIAS